jgi:hypothetical protein
MRKTVLVALAAALAVSAPAAAFAAACDTEIEQATEQQRKQYVEGMSGVANSNFSTRPGSFSQIGCLDKFMKGDMDIFFRPPTLDSLLEKAVSFACEKITSATSSGGGGGDAAILSKFSDLAGSVNIPSTAAASLKSATGGSF